MKKQALFALAATLGIAGSTNLPAQAVGVEELCEKLKVEGYVVNAGQIGSVEEWKEILKGYGIDPDSINWKDCPIVNLPGTACPETSTPEEEDPAQGMNCPEISIPGVDCPGINTPETCIPETDAPETGNPDLNTPETSDTNAPETEAPDTNVSETETPDTNTPETETPDTNASETETPDTNASETEAPDTNASETETPDTNAPETETPATNAPETETPDTNAPGAETPGTSGTETDTPATNTPGSAASDTTFKNYIEQIVELVNAERAKVGLSALTLDEQLSSAALIRAKESEISFSHTRPDGRSFSTVLTDQGITFRGAGENIAWGQKTPEEVMNAWMNSEGHRANILNSKFTKIGVGCYQNASGRKYWSQLFTY